MRVIELQAENIKRLRAVTIRPGTHGIVEIAGKNGQGKTSVLDALWWAIGGENSVQAEPIRRGEDKARIRLDLGEFIVTRKFKRREGGGQTSSLVVETPEGDAKRSPQGLLNDLIDGLTFDPLAFTRMKPADQVEQLRRFVAGIDFAAIETAIEADYEKRTEVNRDQARAESAAMFSANGADPTYTDAVYVDVAALTTALEEAIASNADRQRKQDLRERAAADVIASRGVAAQRRARIAALEAEIVTVRTEAEELEAHANHIEQRLAEAGELPPVADVAKLRTDLDEAHAHNRLVDHNKALTAERDRLRAQAAALKKESDALTASIDERRSIIKRAVAEAKMPIEGLGFGVGTITLNGIPFAQASDAEQLRASIAIAGALNPKLRVIRVRDGSLLDDDSMKLLAEYADANDLQVWIETVGDGHGRPAVIIEDGSVAVDEVADASADQRALDLNTPKT